MIERRPENSASWNELRRRLRVAIERKVSAPDVDDVVQEVLIRVQRALPTLRDSERFGPWLYAIVGNVVASHHRASYRERAASGGDLAQGAPDDAREAAERLSACIAPLLAELPSPYREALMLVELDGLTQAAAAEMLGISLPGMKSRVQRGRKKLRELFDSCCDVTLDVRSRVVDFESRSAEAGCACGVTSSRCKPS